MKRARSYISGLLIFAVVALILYPCVAPAATCEKWAGKVVSAQGVVEVKRAGEAQWQPVKLNETYCPGDTIRTDRKSRADIALYNHPVLRLDQNSTVALGGMKDERTSLVDLVSGAALFFSRVTRNLEVRTATVNAGVEGTEFFIRAEEGKTEMSVFEGKVLASNAAGGLPVTTGQSAVAEAGKAPVHRVVVRPRDAVRWALYYPPVIDPRPADLKEQSNDPRFFTYRASRRWPWAGSMKRRQTSTGPWICPEQQRCPGAAGVHRGGAERERRRRSALAQKGRRGGPEIRHGLIALSYAQQARLRSAKGHRRALKEAVQAGPQNALAWARLAELQQSFGELEQVPGSGPESGGLEPGSVPDPDRPGLCPSDPGRDQRRRGRPLRKRSSWIRPIPLPRLGLGLAKIREGELEEGRREHRDGRQPGSRQRPGPQLPGQGLLRGEARQAGSKTSTPWPSSSIPRTPRPSFYEAIQKQTTNRPVEALQDLQKAIELNDNRAVYRSQLLLDSDLAARSASLARIYSDLGFQQLALIEGWKSVNTDPANYSAHRFLADSYSVLPRHEIARVSELLQSQLLQPINITPIQPRLAESNLFVISGGRTGRPVLQRVQPPVQPEPGRAGERPCGGGQHGRRGEASSEACTTMSPPAWGRTISGRMGSG